MDSPKKDFKNKNTDLQKDNSDTRSNLSKSFDSGMSKAKKFTKRLLWSILGLIVLAIVGFFLWGNYTYSEGTRSGELIKISKKGYVFKTHEGQLKLGGIDMENKDEGLSDTWSFSVTDHDIVTKLEKMQGEKVVLRYKEINYSMPWQGDTNYYIIGVEER